jgi:hypothetical protein
MVALGLVLSIPAVAAGEGARRVVIWPVGDAGEAIAAAHERIERLGDVVDLPASATPGASDEEQRLRAEASASVEEAQAAYYQADFARAGELLDTFLDDRGEVLASQGCLDVSRHVLLWLGASLAKLDRGDDAAAAFALAVTLGQDEIDRALFPPDVTAVFDRARAQVAAAPLGRLEVDVTPGAAAIEVDGRTVTPEEGPLDLAAGRHVVVARRPGYRPRAAEVVVAGGEATRLVLGLEPADEALLGRQVALLRRDGALRADDIEHLALVAAATGTDLIALVSDAGEVRLVDAAGEEVPWPEVPVDEEGPTSEPGSGETPAPAPATPAWRRWWFWVAMVGGAAVLATGVGLGVYYGTRPEDRTITIVPAGGR